MFWMVRLQASSSHSLRTAAASSICASSATFSLCQMKMSLRCSRCPNGATLTLWFDECSFLPFALPFSRRLAPLSDETKQLQVTLPFVVFPVSPRACPLIYHHLTSLEILKPRWRTNNVMLLLMNLRLSRAALTNQTTH